MRNGLRRTVNRVSFPDAVFILEYLVYNGFFTKNIFKEKE